MSNNILITGITSIHGWPIFSYFQKKLKARVFGICPHKMKRYFKHQENVFFADVENLAELKNVFTKVQPKTVLHAAGVCDLDMCEEMPEFAHKINVLGAKNIAKLSKQAYLMYIGSDLVFSGKHPLANGYTERCHTDPVSVVGKTYVKAEKEILKHKNSAIVRVTLPIGPSITGTKGAVDFIAKRLKAKRKTTLFFDEVRSLITTADLAKGVFKFFNKKGRGIYHLGGSKEYSLYDIGMHVAKTLISEHSSSAGLSLRYYTQKYIVPMSHKHEENGPPRVGRISLNSQKFYEFTGFVPSCVF